MYPPRRSNSQSAVYFLNKNSPIKNYIPVKSDGTGGVEPVNKAPLLPFKPKTALLPQTSSDSGNGSSIHQKESKTTYSPSITSYRATRSRKLSLAGNLNEISFSVLIEAGIVEPGDCLVFQDHYAMINPSGRIESETETFDSTLEWIPHVCRSERLHLDLDHFIEHGPDIDSLQILPASSYCIPSDPLKVRAKPFKHRLEQFQNMRKENELKVHVNQINLQISPDNHKKRHCRLTMEQEIEDETGPKKKKRKLRRKDSSQDYVPELDSSFISIVESDEDIEMEEVPKNKVATAETTNGGNFEARPNQNSDQSQLNSKKNNLKKKLTNNTELYDNIAELPHRKENPIGDFLFGGPSKDIQKDLSENVIIATSGLTKHQLLTLNASLEKLGGTLEKEISNRTTHLVVGTDNRNIAARTIKYLESLLKGIYVVSMQWILESLAKETFLDAKPFLVSGDKTYLGGPQKSIKSHMKQNPKLFEHIHVWLHGKFAKPGHPTPADFVRLLELGGATVVCDELPVKNLSMDQLNQTKDSLLICDEEMEKELVVQISAKTGFPAISSQWILDSISHYEIMDKTIYYFEPPVEDIEEISASLDL